MLCQSLHSIHTQEFWPSDMRGGGLSANSFCHGFTQTSRTRCKGDHTADDAASVGARLALLPPEQIPTGKFFLWVCISGNVIPSKL